MQLEEIANGYFSGFLNPLKVKIEVNADVGVARIAFDPGPSIDYSASIIDNLDIDQCLSNAVQDHEKFMKLFEESYDRFVEHYRALHKHHRRLRSLNQNGSDALSKESSAICKVLRILDYGAEQMDRAESRAALRGNKDFETLRELNKRINIRFKYLLGELPFTNEGYEEKSQ